MSAWRLHGELVDVGPRDECLIASARQDYRAHAIVLLQIQDGATQLVDRVRVQRVEDLGAVDRDDRDGAVTLEEEIVKSHAVLQWKRIHQPAENDGRRNESCKHQSSEPHLMSRLVLGNHCEDDRDEKRKQDEKKDVAPHEGYFLRYFLRYFRPTATSYASITTSRFNSPATTRKALPYS